MSHGTVIQTFNFHWNYISVSNSANLNTRGKNLKATLAKGFNFFAEQFLKEFNFFKGIQQILKIFTILSLKLLIIRRVLVKNQWKLFINKMEHFWNFWAIETFQTLSKGFQALLEKFWLNAETNFNVFCGRCLSFCRSKRSSGAASMYCFLLHLSHILHEIIYWNLCLSSSSIGSCKRLVNLTSDFTTLFHTINRWWQMFAAYDLFNNSSVWYSKGLSFSTYYQ